MSGRTLAVLALLLTASSAGAAGEPSSLIAAVRRHDAQAVRTLLARRVDVDARQGDGATALHWAAHMDDLSTVDALIRAGARVNLATDLGVTPLYLACTNRGGAVVERLLDAGAGANAALVNGETVLMNCARTGDARAVRALLAHGADPNVAETAHDQTALMWAAAQKHPEAAAALIAAGADVKARSRRYTQTVTSEVTQRAGREALNYTVPRGGMTALHFAARSGDADSIRLLIAAGADVDDALPDGLTPLTLAAHSGQGAAGVALLERGANANAAAIGYTALHAAVLRADPALVRALLAHGADPNAPITRGTPMRRTSQDFDLPAVLMGATPYLLAAKFLDVDLMRELARGGADTRRPMKDGTTPLMAAVGMGSAAPLDRRGVSTIDGGRVESEEMVLAAVSAALELGANVGAANTSGDTALHAAVALGHDRVVQLLVDKGADVNARNGRGQTPLAALSARRDGAARERTASLLKSLGAVE
jgi:ankyrin repeat protein